MGNYRELIAADGEPRFRFIVEGANLFFSQDARLKLEEHGVIIIKDATANKGGVISSSFEVLASLALSEDQFRNIMCKKDVDLPEDHFRKKYVRQILEKICLFAKLEFAVLWQEKQYSGRSMTLISDELSAKINELTDTILTSKMYEDVGLFRKVIRMHIPAVLRETVGIENILIRVPQRYLLNTIHEKEWDGLK
jgi:glutamate dehydrogenase